MNNTNLNERTLPYMNAFGTVDISSAKSVEDALNLASLDWNVIQKPVYDEYGNEYEKFRINLREDTSKVLGMVTSSYNPVQNLDAFEFVNDLSQTGGFKFDRAGAFKGGKAIWVMGHLPKVDILGDDIDNNVVFINSHDGTAGVKVLMTPVRCICSNMLNLAIKRAQRSWTAKHTIKINSRLEEARHTLSLANNYIDKLTLEAEQMASTKISEAEIEAIFDAMFPMQPGKDTERKIRNISLLKNGLFKCYNEDDIKQFKGTVYGAVNAFADLIDHRTPGRITENYAENAWYKLINGHAELDEFYRRVRSI